MQLPEFLLAGYENFRQVRIPSTLEEDGVPNSGWPLAYRASILHALRHSLQNVSPMATTPRYRAWEFRRARWWPAVAAIAAAFAGILVWAHLRTIAGCAHPDCAETRFRVHVEIDSLSGVEELPLEVDGPDGPVSARALLATGGIDVEITRDQTNLPYEPSAGALDQVDLLAYLDAWSVRALRSGFDGQVYALAAPGLQSETGTPLFGVLFDLGAREAIAVAPLTTRRLFSRYEPDAVPLLQLRTLSHELLHAFNRHHVDAEHAPDGRLTVEAPTRCISEVSDRGWRLNETPLMRLSSRTVRHFQHAPSVDVLPGAAKTAFDLGRGAARECDLARRTPMGRRRTPLTLLRQWFFGLTGISNAKAGDDVGRRTDAAAELELTTQAAPYPLGFPVTVRLQARNTGTASLAVVDRLSPEYAVVRIETRAEGSDEWRRSAAAVHARTAGRRVRHARARGRHLAVDRDLLRRRWLDVRATRTIRGPRADEPGEGRRRGTERAGPDRHIGTRCCCGRGGAAAVARRCGSARRGSGPLPGISRANSRGRGPPASVDADRRAPADGARRGVASDRWRAGVARAHRSGDRPQSSRRPRNGTRPAGGRMPGKRSHGARPEAPANGRSRRSRRRSRQSGRGSG